MDQIKQNILGISGLILLSLGIVLPAGSWQNLVNVMGISSLIIYAWRSRNQFFFYLEIVVLVGTLLKIAGVSVIVTLMTLVITTLIVLAQIFQQPQYREWRTVCGLIGLLGLVFGYASLNPIGYLVGGIGLIIYSWLSYQSGIKSALIFALLNLIYSLLALISLLN